MRVVGDGSGVERLPVVDDNIQTLKDHLKVRFGYYGSFEGTDIAELDDFVARTREQCPESMRKLVSQWWLISRESILALQAVVSSHRYSLFTG